MVLEQYRYIHPYMYKRKMTDAIIELFDIGYDRESDCITFPVRDASGRALFVARRSVKDKWYSYPRGAEKPLYGLYEAYREYPNDTEVYITESMINCLTLWNYGIPAIALNGTGSKEQYERLKNIKYRTLVLCLDPDNAGRTGMNKIKNYCKNKIIKTVTYKDNRDINDLTRQEVQELLDTKHLFYAE